jgi:long-chain fatty acid transport protein
LHIDLSGQTLLMYFNNKDVRVGDFSGAAAPLSPLLSRPAETLRQDHPSPLLPNLHIAYNFGDVGRGKLAAYMQAGVVAGGGALKYKNGTAGTTFLLTGLSAAMGGTLGTISAQEFNASSVYYAIGGGASYAFNDMVSASFSGRAVMAKRDFDMAFAYSTQQTMNGKYEYNAMGFTPIFGVTVKPARDITLAARFEAPTSLEFKYDQKELGGTLETVAAGVLGNAGIVDGKKFHQDLPAVIGLGAEYRINDQWTVDLSGTFYLLSKADLGDVYDNGVKVAKVNEYFNTGWEVALGATYNVVKDLKIGAGVMYAEVGAKKEYLNDPRIAFNSSANPSVDSMSLGTGVTYTIRPNLDFTLSMLWNPSKHEDFSIDSGAFKVTGKYSVDYYSIGYGVSYRF